MVWSDLELRIYVNVNVIAERFVNQRLTLTSLPALAQSCSGLNKRLPVGKEFAVALNYRSMSTENYFVRGLSRSSLACF